MRESFRLFPIDQPADAVAETPALAERPCRGTGQVCQRREAPAGKLRQQIDHQLVHHTVEEQPAKQLHLTGVCHLGHIGAALAHAFQFAHQVDERIAGRKRERAAAELQRKTFPVVPEPFHPLPASRRKIPVEGECRDYLYLCHTSFRIKSRKRETHATPDRGSGKPENRSAWAHAIRYSISLTQQLPFLEMYQISVRNSCDLCIISATDTVRHRYSSMSLARPLP